MPPVRTFIVAPAFGGTVDDGGGALVGVFVGVDVGVVAGVAEAGCAVGSGVAVLGVEKSLAVKIWPLNPRRRE
jgi:hypothetical protein